MENALQAIGGGAFLVVSTVLGVRLLLLAVRNRALPELLLAVAFLAGGTVGALLEAGASVQTRTLDGAIVGRMIAIAKAFGVLGISANCAFTWWVFRRQNAWGLPLVATLVAVQAVAYAGHAAAGTFSTGQMTNTWFWVEFAARIASPTWLGIEAWRYHTQMRRRVRVGLADPVVADRFRLWAIASATGIVFLLTSVPPMIFPVGTPFVTWDILVFGLAGVATAGAYWLAFFPPAAYRRSVVARAGLAAG